MSAPSEFYERAYANTGAEGVRFGRWRALTGAAKADRLLRTLPRLPADGVSVLDVGCGDGALLVELAQKRPGWALAGVEISGRAAAIATDRLPGVPVDTYDGTRLPWQDSHFDVGVLSHVLEHVADPLATLLEAARVCRLVVVEVPLERNLSARRRSRRVEAHAIGHLHRLSRSDVRRLVTAAGLELRDEVTGTLSREALRFFAAGRRARRAADAKWLVQRALHRCAPTAARRLFTVQYLVVCESSRR